MQCQEFEDRWNELLDERGCPQADPRLAAHAGECESCRGLLTGGSLLLRGLTQLPIPPLGREFARRVVTQVASDRESSVTARPASRAWLAVGVLLASAAAALLAISLVWYARRGGDHVAGGGNRPAVVNRSAPGASPRRRGPAYAFGGQLLLSAPRLPSFQNYRGAIDNLAVTLPQTVEQLDQMERLAPGIRPVRLSLAMFWQTLRRSIPGSCSEEPAHPRTTSWPHLGGLVA